MRKLEEISKSKSMRMKEDSSMRNGLRIKRDKFSKLNWKMQGDHKNNLQVNSMMRITSWTLWCSLNNKLQWANNSEEQLRIKGFNHLLWPEWVMDNNKSLNNNFHKLLSERDLKLSISNNNQINMIHLKGLYSSSIIYSIFLENTNKWEWFTVFSWTRRH